MDIIGNLRRRCIGKHVETAALPEKRYCFGYQPSGFFNVTLLVKEDTVGITCQHEFDNFPGTAEKKGDLGYFFGF